jgi:hypothetical protein
MWSSAIAHQNRGKSKRCDPLMESAGARPKTTVRVLDAMLNNACHHKFDVSNRSRWTLADRPDRHPSSILEAASISTSISIDRVPLRRRASCCVSQTMSSSSNKKGLKAWGGAEQGHARSPTNLAAMHAAGRASSETTLRTLQPIDNPLEPRLSPMS